MPYPLLTLPYGLQRRLRSLATPKEAYCLQVAVGQQKSYLHPLQMYFKDDSWDLFISNKDGNMILTDSYPLEDYANVLDWENENLRWVRFMLKLYILKADDFDSPIFHHILINCPRLGVYKSILNPATFDKLSKHLDCNKLRELILMNNICTDLTVPMICDKFSNLQRLKIYSPDYVSHNWIIDILNREPLSLLQLTLTGEFEKLFSCTPDELSRFLQREKAFFDLTLHCLNPPANAAELIRLKFGPHFKEVRNSEYDGFNVGLLNIKLGHDCADINFSISRLEAVHGLCFQVVPIETCYPAKCEVKTDVVTESSKRKNPKTFPKNLRTVLTISSES